MKNNKKAMLTAAVSGILLAASYAIPVSAHGGERGECYGVNSCKGKGDCGGKDPSGKHGCAGKNECKGKGWLKMTEEACDQKGGTFKPKS